ncbi:MAG TPA: prepilin-type N-terminal cleavage/methylation domain-containing protein [Solirubrobacteraceae bacterium]|nr:prepilin-type N-terminal cleavage/methylation domain-containing protein [Solirubrobacteraceae bacterium]
MKALPRKLRAVLRDERGFTLIELLVASLAGIIVSMATGAIVIASVHFSSNFGNRVDSNQEGRVAMEKITQALNSSCVATGVTPLVGTPAPTGMVGGVASGSDASNLVFYSALSDSPTIEPNEVVVSLTGTAPSQQLVMFTYTNTKAGTTPPPPPPWTFSTTPTPSGGFVLLPNAAQATIGGSVVPVFQYFGYAGSGTSQINTTPYAVPLSATDAATTAEVTISFEALPSNRGANVNAPSAGANLSDSVVLKLTPASSAPNGSNTPCT